jgi:hypothetical protein
MVFPSNKTNMVKIEITIEISYTPFDKQTTMR